MTFREMLMKDKCDQINEGVSNSLINKIIPIIDSMISGHGKSIDEHTYKFENFKVVWNEDDEQYEYYDGNKLALTAIFKDNENGEVVSYDIINEIAMCNLLSITIKGKYNI